MPRGFADGAKVARTSVRGGHMERQDVLYVRMFGNFQMHYGAGCWPGERVKDTHFTSLMQILLHNVAEGVSRDVLEEVLLGDRDIENRHQALQTIIYKSKQKLKRMGLPEANYIKLEKGIYHWTPLIPVSEDAAVFDGLCAKVEEALGEEEKLRWCLGACYAYKGEFLSDYAGVIWASAEARRYRRKFCECVEQAARILRKRQDWLRLEDLGRYVTGVAPFSDWECLTMEALVESGRYEDASRLYADTVESYLVERGVSPSAKFAEMMDKLGNRMRHAYEALDQIQGELSEDMEDVQGGYQCPYPVFRGIYQIVSRMMERGGQSVYLMSCTLVDGKGNPLREGEKLEALSARLGDAIRNSVRHGDVINQYGGGQFLILLINTTRENCDVIERRINRNFTVGRERTGIRYHVNSVICEA